MSSSGSSLSSPPQSQGALQPFQCQVCQKRFTRHENLKRHAALHAQKDQDLSFPCSYCSTVFSRRDLRKRHVKKRHPSEFSATIGDNPRATKVQLDTEHDGDRQPPLSSSFTANSGPLITNNPVRANEFTNVFDNDVLGSLGGGHLSIEEILAANSTHTSYALDETSSDSNEPIGGPSFRSIFNGSGPTQPDQAFFPPPFLLDDPGINRLPLNGTPPPSSIQRPSEREIALGIELFFTKVSHCFPFVHHPTFDRSTTPEALLMGMLSLSLQYMDDQTYGVELGSACFHRGRQILETDHLKDRIAAGLELYTIQACLMLEMHAIMSTCGSQTAYGLRMHSRCVELARIGGLAEPLPDLSAASDLESLWRQFVRIESHKRTFFALYQLDVMWYHILSIPRTISHLEIKLDLPCSQQLWDATAPSYWAHRSLVMGKNPSNQPSKYVQAVRTCLVVKPQHCISDYDAYGSLLIILFMLSSVREQSGWSTMTGRVSFERFEALHSSLRALEGSMRLSAEDTTSVVCEATWHISMIELLLWSPSHTNGVVEGSLDAALAAGAHLAVTQPAIMSGNVVESLDVHLRFFLLYLNQTNSITADCESPWVTIYCFKAVLIAWQMMRAGVGNVTACIGIPDLENLYEWIKNVFSLRSRFGVGHAVLSSLNELEAVSLGSCGFV